MKYKIEHDRPECIGCGSCVSICSGFWEMNKDGKSDLKKAKNVGKKQILEINEQDSGDMYDSIIKGLAKLGATETEDEAEEEETEDVSSTPTDEETLGQ